MPHCCLIFLGAYQTETHLARHVSGEVAVGGKLEVAAISCLVIHHINLSRLRRERKKLNDFHFHEGKDEHNKNSERHL